MENESKMPPVSLEGLRVSIRPVAKEDLPAIRGWWNDPTVMRELRAEKFKPSLQYIVERVWPIWKEPSLDQYHEFVIHFGGKAIGEIGYALDDADQSIASVDIKIGDPSL